MAAQLNIELGIGTCRHNSQQKMELEVVSAVQSVQAALDKTASIFALEVPRFKHLGREHCAGEGEPEQMPRLGGNRHSTDYSATYPHTYRTP